MQISYLLSVVLVLLTVAMVIAGLTRHLRLPYTVLLVLMGLMINLASTLTDHMAFLGGFRLTHELVLFVFLPALIFESAMSLDARALLKDLVPVVVMAIPGMLISAFLVGLGLVVSLHVDWIVALLFGALISATDQVEVIALFNELCVSRRIYLLVEG